MNRLGYGELAKFKNNIQGDLPVGNILLSKVIASSKTVSDHHKVPVKDTTSPQIIAATLAKPSDTQTKDHPELPKYKGISKVFHSTLQVVSSVAQHMEPEGAALQQAGTQIVTAVGSAVHHNRDKAEAAELEHFIKNGEKAEAVQTKVTELIRNAVIPILTREMLEKNGVTNAAEVLKSLIKDHYLTEDGHINFDKDIRTLDSGKDEKLKENILKAAEAAIDAQKTTLKFDRNSFDTAVEAQFTELGKLSTDDENLSKVIDKMKKTYEDFKAAKAAGKSTDILSQQLRDLSKDLLALQSDYEIAVSKQDPALGRTMMAVRANGSIAASWGFMGMLLCTIASAGYGQVDSAAWWVSFTALLYYSVNSSFFSNILARNQNIKALEHTLDVPTKFKYLPDTITTRYSNGGFPDEEAFTQDLMVHNQTGNHKININNDPSVLTHWTATYGNVQNSHLIQARAEKIKDILSSEGLDIQNVKVKELALALSMEKRNFKSNWVILEESQAKGAYMGHTVRLSWMIGDRGGEYASNDTIRSIIQDKLLKQQDLTPKEREVLKKITESTLDQWYSEIDFRSLLDDDGFHRYFSAVVEVAGKELTEKEKTDLKDKVEKQVNEHKRPYLNGILTMYAKKAGIPEEKWVPLAHSIITKIDTENNLSQIATLGYKLVHGIITEDENKTLVRLLEKEYNLSEKIVNQIIDKINPSGNTAKSLDESARELNREYDYGKSIPLKTVAEARDMAYITLYQEQIGERPIHQEAGFGKIIKRYKQADMADMPLADKIAKLKLSPNDAGKGRFYEKLTMTLEDLGFDLKVGVPLSEAFSDAYAATYLDSKSWQEKIEKKQAAKPGLSWRAADQLIYEETLGTPDSPGLNKQFRDLVKKINDTSPGTISDYQCDKLWDAVKDLIDLDKQKHDRNLLGQLDTVTQAIVGTRIVSEGLATNKVPELDAIQSRLAATMQNRSDVEAGINLILASPDLAKTIIDRVDSFVDKGIGELRNPKAARFMDGNFLSYEEIARQLPGVIFAEADLTVVARDNEIRDDEGILRKFRIQHELGYAADVKKGKGNFAFYEDIQKLDPEQKAQLKELISQLVNLRNELYVERRELLDLTRQQSVSTKEHHQLEHQLTSVREQLSELKIKIKAEAGASALADLEREEEALIKKQRALDMQQYRTMELEESFLNPYVTVMLHTMQSAKTVVKSTVLEKVPEIQEQLSNFFVNPNDDNIKFKPNIEEIINKSDLSEAGKKELLAISHKSIAEVTDEVKANAGTVLRLGLIKETKVYGVGKGHEAAGSLAAIDTLRKGLPGESSAAKYNSLDYLVGIGSGINTQLAAQGKATEYESKYKLKVAGSKEAPQDWETIFHWERMTHERWGGSKANNTDAANGVSIGERIGVILHNTLEVLRLQNETDPEIGIKAIRIPISILKQLQLEFISKFHLFDDISKDEELKLKLNMTESDIARQLVKDIYGTTDITVEKKSSKQAVDDMTATWLKDETVQKHKSELDDMKKVLYSVASEVAVRIYGGRAIAISAALMAAGTDKELAALLNEKDDVIFKAKLDASNFPDNVKEYIREARNVTLNYAGNINDYLAKEFPHLSKQELSEIGDILKIYEKKAKATQAKLIEIDTWFQKENDKVSNNKILSDSEKVRDRHRIVELKEHRERTEILFKGEWFTHNAQWQPQPFANRTAQWIGDRGLGEVRRNEFILPEGRNIQQLTEYRLSSMGNEVPEYVNYRGERIAFTSMIREIAQFLDVENKRLIDTKAEKNLGNITDLHELREFVSDLLQTKEDSNKVEKDDGNLKIINYLDHTRWELPATQSFDVERDFDTDNIHFTIAQDRSNAYYRKNEIGEFDHSQKATFQTGQYYINSHDRFLSAQNEMGLTYMLNMSRTFSQTGTQLIMGCFIEKNRQAFSWDISEWVEIPDKQRVDTKFFKSLELPKTGDNAIDKKNDEAWKAFQNTYLRTKLFSKALLGLTLLSLGSGLLSVGGLGTLVGVASLSTLFLAANQKQGFTRALTTGVLVGAAAMYGVAMASGFLTAAAPVVAGLAAGFALGFGREKTLKFLKEHFPQNRFFDPAKAFDPKTLYETIGIVGALTIGYFLGGMFALPAASAVAVGYFHNKYLQDSIPAGENFLTRSITDHYLEKQVLENKSGLGSDWITSKMPKGWGYDWLTANMPTISRLTHEPQTYTQRSDTEDFATTTNVIKKDYYAAAHESINGISEAVNDVATLKGQRVRWNGGNVQETAYAIKDYFRYRQMMPESSWFRLNVQAQAPFSTFAKYGLHGTLAMLFALGVTPMRFGLSLETALPAFALFSLFQYKLFMNNLSQVFIDTGRTADRARDMLSTIRLLDFNSFNCAIWRGVYRTAMEFSTTKNPHVRIATTEFIPENIELAIYKVMGPVAGGALIAGLAAGSWLPMLGITIFYWMLEPASLNIRAKELAGSGVHGYGTHDQKMGDYKKENAGKLLDATVISKKLVELSGRLEANQKYSDIVADWTAMAKVFGEDVQVGLPVNTQQKAASLIEDSKTLQGDDPELVRELTDLTDKIQHLGQFGKPAIISQVAFAQLDNLERRSPFEIREQMKNSATIREQLHKKGILDSEYRLSDKINLYDKTLDLGLDSKFDNVRAYVIEVLQQAGGLSELQQQVNDKALVEREKEKALRDKNLRKYGK